MPNFVFLKRTSKSFALICYLNSFLVFYSIRQYSTLIYFYLIILYHHTSFIKKEAIVKTTIKKSFKFYRYTARKIP